MRTREGGDKRTTRLSTIILVLILLLGIGIRIPHLFSPLIELHDFRETQTASAVWLYYEYGFHPFSYHVAMFGGQYWILEFPLYQQLVYALTRIFGLHDYLGRLVSLFCFIITAVTIYSIASKLYKDYCSPLLSVFIYTLLPISVYYYRSYMIDPFVLTLCLLAMALAFRLIERYTADKCALLFVLIFLAVMIKLTTLLAFILPLCYLLYAAFLKLEIRERSRQIRLIALYSFIIAFSFIGWRIYAFIMNTRSIGLRDGSFMKWYIGTRLFDINFYKVIWGRIEGELSFIGLFMLIIGLYVAREHKNDHSRVLLLWFMNGAIYVLLFNNLNFVHNYYQLPLYSIITLLVVSGISHIGRAFNYSKRYIVSFMILMLIFVFSCYSTYTKDYLSYNPAVKQTILSTTSIINRHTIIHEKVVLIWPNADPNYPNLLYLAKRVGYNYDLNKLKDLGSLIHRDKDIKSLAIFPVSSDNKDRIMKVLANNNIGTSLIAYQNSLLLLRIEN